jgi:hypothetical protein
VVTDTDPDLSKFRQKINERRAQQAVNRPPTWDDDLIPELADGGGISEAAKKVNEACASIDIFEVYDRLVGRQREELRGRTESVMAICPAHDEKSPSAWFGMKDGEWFLCCGHDMSIGWDKYGLAALVWNLNSKGDFWQIKCRLAEQLRGVVYEAERAASAPTPAPPPRKPLGEMPTPHVEPPEPSPWDKKLEERTNHHLLEAEARRKARQIENAGLFTPPTFSDDLEAELIAPDPDIEWTIENLHSVGGNTTITAGFKVGKTTFVMNLVKALADQEKFLGTQEVRALEGRIALWNFEVEQVQMKRTFREMGIKKLANIWHLPLRGHPMNLMDDAAYAWALAEMRRQEIEVWILDPFSGAYYGDENDNSQINAFTKRLDEFKREAGIKDLFMPVHTGRYVEEGNERARGGAKLDDWTDNRWVLTKQAGDRFFKAEGRRVEQEERGLIYDRMDNSLAYSPQLGGRREKGRHVSSNDVLAFIASNAGCGSRDIRNGKLGKTETVSAILGELIAVGEVETLKVGAKTCHYIAGTAPIGTV